MDVEFKSPLKKLVVFFKKSRDNWKEKARQAKYDLKIANNRIKFLENSRNKLKKTISDMNEINTTKKQQAPDIDTLNASYKDDNTNMDSVKKKT